MLSPACRALAAERRQIFSFGSCFLLCLIAPGCWFILLRLGGCREAQEKPRSRIRSLSPASKPSDGVCLCCHGWVESDANNATTASRPTALPCQIAIFREAWSEARLLSQHVRHGALLASGFGDVQAVRLDVQRFYRLVTKWRASTGWRRGCIQSWWCSASLLQHVDSSPSPWEAAGTLAER